MSKKKKRSKAKVKTSVTRSINVPYLERRSKYIALGAFVLLAFVLYFQCIPYGYVLDDKLVISENNFTKKGLAGLWDIFTTDSFQGYFGEQKLLLEGGRYRPLSIASFAVEYQFFGLNSSVSHAINILLYGLSAFLAFITLRRLFYTENSSGKNIFLTLAFLASLIFLVHPIHTEAVANIKGRDEIMSFMFSMLSLFYAVKYIDLDRSKYLWIMAGVFFLGILSKENTITFLAITPFALLLFRSGFKSATVKVFGVLLGTTVGYLIMRYLVMGYLLNDYESNDIMNNPFYGMDGSERLATIFYTLIIYLKLCVFPHPLTHDYYPYHIPIMDFSKIWVWVSVIVHLLLAGSVFYFWKKNKKIAFSIGFYLASMSIVSNLVVSVGTFMNERFAFTASLSACILMVMAFKYLNAKFNTNNKLLIGMMLLACIPYIYKTMDRVPAWETALTLNREAIKVSKNSARANSFMSTALFNAYKESQDREEKLQLLHEAQPYALKAVSLIPNYYNGNLMRAGIAAELHKMTGDLDGLLEEFEAVIMERPDVSFVTEYLNYLTNRADLNTMMAFYVDIGQKMYNERRNMDWAVHYLKIAHEIDRSNTQVKGLLYQLLIALGYTEEAAKFR